MFFGYSPHRTSSVSRAFSFSHSILSFAGLVAVYTPGQSGSPYFRLEKVRAPRLPSLPPGLPFRKIFPSSNRGNPETHAGALSRTGKSSMREPRHPPPPRFHPITLQSIAFQNAISNTGRRLKQKAIRIGNLVENAITYFIATPPDRGWQRNEGLLLLHSFLSLDIECNYVLQ